MPNKPSKLRRITLLSIMAAACIAIQLIPRPPNVEFTSVITFTVGVVFGSVFGATLGALVMLINGFLSPFGFGGLLVPFQMLGMTIIGFVGGLFKEFGIFKKITTEGTARLCVEAAVLGAFLTLVYDIITNAGFAVTFGVPIIAAILTGVALSVIHVSSNTILFGFLAIPLSYAMQNVLGDRKPRQ